MRMNHAFLSLRTYSKHWLASLVLAIVFFSHDAEASIFKGEALDKMADVLTWIVLVVAPIVAIAIFLLIHILPEKIAEKRHHPQAKAIQCMCLLSLVFGGLLWPLAWLWAYTRPVIHKLAYGTDKVVHNEEAVEEPVEPLAAPAQSDEVVQETKEEAKELVYLRERINELEVKLRRKLSPEGGKA